MIEVHGAPRTLQSARNRIKRLEAENRKWGASDGRVTEINALRNALAKCDEAQARYDREAAEKRAEEARVKRAAQRAALMTPQVEADIRDAQRELKYLERNTHGSGRIEYIDNRTDSRRVARYTTRDGFLRGFIKFSSDPLTYAVIDVNAS